MLLMLAGCDIPAAAPEKNPTLVVVTDILNSKDSLLFSQFEKTHNVTIVFKEMTAESLIQRFQNDPYGLGVDIVFLHQAYDMRLVQQHELLERLHKTDFPQESQLSASQEFITCGIDPFVCVSKKNTSIRIYDDLNNRAYLQNLSHKSLTHFFAPYEKRLHRSKTFERVQKLHEKSMEMNLWNADSAQTILTMYSDYKMKKPEDSVWNHFTNVQFPNSATSGVFYDVLTAGIIRQSSNYQLSTELLKWVTSQKINPRFAKNRGYNSIYDSSEYRRFKSPADVLMQYHTMIERMLSEVE